MWDLLTSDVGHIDRPTPVCLLDLFQGTGPCTPFGGEVTVGVPEVPLKAFKGIGFSLPLGYLGQVSEEPNAHYF